MLALKKKREAEQKAKKAELAAVDNPSTDAPSAPTSKKVSILGVGGKKTKSSAEKGASGGKRRTPGELRIQKGTFVLIPMIFPSQIMKLTIL